MKTANYRIRRQIEGLGSFADVTVCDAPGSDESQLARTPRAWITAAELGVRAALATLECTTSRVSLVSVVYTYVDTTDDAVHAAAFMATVKLLGKDHEFQLSRRDGTWCVLRAETA